MKRAVIYTDGACSGNPGPAGIGVAIEFQGHSIHIAEHIGSATNNVAEYSALMRGLMEARDLGADEVEVYMDSELAVKQVRGLYKVKNQGLRPIFESVIKLLKSFKKHKVSHVPREQNALADMLSKQGVKTGSKPFKKVTPPFNDNPSASREPSETGNSGSGGQGSLPF
jgi:ribonuclease HI